MHSILQTEDYVPVSPEVMADPFYRIAYLVKQEIRKFKWIESEAGRNLTWEEARRQWCGQNRERYLAFMEASLQD